MSCDGFGILLLTNVDSLGLRGSTNTTTTNFLFVLIFIVLLLFSHTIRLVVLDDPDARLSLAAAILLEDSISEVSKKIASAIGESKQEKEFLCQKFVAIQRKVSALQRSTSNPTPSDATNDGARSELDDDDQREADALAELGKRSRLYNLAPRRGR